MRAVVIDKDGGLSPYTTAITVNNVAPTGNLANGPVEEGDRSRLLRRRLRRTHRSCRGIRYGYDFGTRHLRDRGGTYATASPLAAVDAPAALTADGDRDIVVRAVLIDKDGGLRPATSTVTVTNVAPTATLTGDSVDEGETATVTFSAQADPSAADTAAGFTYEYDLDDDGTFEPGGACVTPPTTDGPATIHVTGAITDRDGGRREYDTTVTVGNLAPATSAGRRPCPPTARSRSRSPRRTRAGMRSPARSSGATARRGHSTRGAVSHTYAVSGAYSVTVRGGTTTAPTPRRPPSR